MATIELREVSGENREAIRALRVRPDQEQFVASVEGSFRDAEETPEGNPWYRAVYADGMPVGFVMLSWNVTPQPGIRGPWFLWRLLIDQAHQGRGYGKATLDAIVELIRAEGATDLLTSYHPGEGEPLPFYLAYGFEPTGEIDEDGEPILRLELP